MDEQVDVIYMIALEGLASLIAPKQDEVLAKTKRLHFDFLPD